MVATRTGSDSPPDPGISVHSHPRSGTHYLMALLNENFIHAPSFRDLDWGNSERTERGNILHALPEDCTPWFEKAAKHFYIWREFEAVAESILRIPGRFGIDRRLPVSEFAKSKWSELYNRGLEWQWLVDGEIERGVTPGCGPPIPTPEMTTFDFWAHHVDCWKRFAARRNDVLVVRYEDLIDDFQASMENIASWLGVEKKNFLNITEKVGGQPL